MEVTFRRAELKDDAGTLALLAERHREVDPDTPVPFTENGAELFQATVSSDASFIVIGERNGTIVATLTVYVLPHIRLGGHFALLESVVVTASLRGMGIGTKLMEFTIEECRKDTRIRKIKLGSRKEEMNVHAFYERLGFTYQEKFYQLTL